MIQQCFATPRDLEEAGLGRARLQAIPLAQRRRNLVRASGWLAPALRKRNQLPLRVDFDPADLDTGSTNGLQGMTGGGSVAWSLAEAATTVQSVAIQFPSGGSGPGTPYQVNYFNGAYGSAFGVGGTLDSASSLTIDGQTFTVSGTVAANDSFGYATVTDSGVTMATVAMAAWICLHNTGVDAKTEQDLQKLMDVCIKPFKEDVAKGEGDLEIDEDATPGVPELGPLGSGQREPWSWLGGPRLPRPPHRIA